MPDDTNTNELFCALDDAIAIAHEWDGAGIAAKLQAFGLDPEEVAEVLRERIEAYRDEFSEGEPDVAFTQGFVEGLITGRKLDQGGRDGA